MEVKIERNISNIILSSSNGVPLIIDEEEREMRWWPGLHGLASGMNFGSRRRKLGGCQVDIFE